MPAVSGLGARVRQLRAIRGWTQEEVAEASGLAQTTVSAIESSRKYSRAGSPRRSTARIPNSINARRARSCSERVSAVSACHSSSVLYIQPSGSLPLSDQ